MGLSANNMRNDGCDLTAVDSVLYRHLVQLLGLKRSPDLSLLLGHRQKMAKLAVRDVWSQNSFLEDYAQKLDLDLHVVFGKLLRENPSTPLNPAIFGVSPVVTSMPPILFPLYPISQRDNEITIVSEVPGLNRLLPGDDFRCLNEFWGVEHLNAVWAEPAHLREAIRQAGTHVTFAQNSETSLRNVCNGGVPWIALDSISPSDKINQWFSPALQRKYGAIPVYAGKRILTLAVARLLDPRLKAEIEGALRHRFAIQQVLADEAALKRFITAYTTGCGLKSRVHPIHQVSKQRDSLQSRTRTQTDTDSKGVAIAHGHAKSRLKMRKKCQISAKCYDKRPATIQSGKSVAKTRKRVRQA